MLSIQVHFMTTIFHIMIDITWKGVDYSLTYHNSALFQAMAWCFHTHNKTQENLALNFIVNIKHCTPNNKLQWKGASSKINEFHKVSEQFVSDMDTGDGLWNFQSFLSGSEKNSCAKHEPPWLSISIKSFQTWCHILAYWVYMQDSFM